jgi:hypothetical protein
VERRTETDYGWIDQFASSRKRKTATCRAKDRSKYNVACALLVLGLAVQLVFLGNAYVFAGGPGTN